MYCKDNAGYEPHKFYWVIKLLCPEIAERNKRYIKFLRNVEKNKIFWKKLKISQDDCLESCMDPIANSLYKTLWFLSALRASKMTGRQDDAYFLLTTNHQPLITNDQRPMTNY